MQKNKPKKQQHCTRNSTKQKGQSCSFQCFPIKLMRVSTISLSSQSYPVLILMQKKSHIYRKDFSLSPIFKVRGFVINNDNDNFLLIIVNNKLKVADMALMLRFGPGPHWWEASALRPQLMPCLLVFRFFGFSYFSTSLIVLIQVYNWEIRHHSLVCYCGLADIFYILVSRLHDYVAVSL